MATSDIFAKINESIAANPEKATSVDSVFQFDITGDDGNDRLTGGSGRDTIDAGDGNNRIDAGDASQHVADEAFMARHVDEGEVVTVATTMGIAEIDGHAATFLLRQPVGIDAGQGA